MGGKETFVDAIKRYGGKEMTICAEDQEIIKYVIPKSASECPDISGKVYKEINEALIEEGIYSISFLSDRVITEMVAQKEKEIPAVRGVDYSIMKNTNSEDWVRLREMFPEKMDVYDPDNLQSIYQ